MFSQTASQMRSNLVKIFVYIRQYNLYNVISINWRCIMTLTTRYKNHKIIALDGTLSGRIHVIGPKVNEILHGGGLEAAIKWIDLA